MPLKVKCKVCGRVVEFRERMIIIHDEKGDITYSFSDPEVRKQRVLYRKDKSYYICPECGSRYKYFVLEEDDFPRTLLEEMARMNREQLIQYLLYLESKGIWIDEKVKQELLRKKEETIYIEIKEE